MKSWWRDDGKMFLWPLSLLIGVKNKSWAPADIKDKEMLELTSCFYTINLRKRCYGSEKMWKKNTLPLRWKCYSLSLSLSLTTVTWILDPKGKGYQGRRIQNSLCNMLEKERERIIFIKEEVCFFIFHFSTSHNITNFRL